jgi:hypothetical protein
MEPFKKARTPAEFRRHLAAAGREAQPCMLCGTTHAPHARDLTLLAADGSRFTIVARFCRSCHAKSDRAERTHAKLEELAGRALPPFTARPRTPRRN